MATYTSVPADVEATSILELVEDCREFSGLLGAAPAAFPTPARGTGRPVEISSAAVHSLAGLGDYGS